MTEAERALFRAAFRDIVPFEPPPVPPPAPPAPVPAPAPRPRPPAAGAPNPGLDRSTARRLARGDLAIDRRLDLHGLRLEDAHAALARFVRGAAAVGARVLLVITGKGTRGPGAIRRELPHWLAAPDLAPLVLRTAPARPRDGGDGAFYILLRRRRG